MYKIDLPVDYNEAAAIERRRNQEEQRKSRIFNSKTRQIGIDQQALEQQMRDKQMMQEMEKRRDEAFAADAARNEKIAMMMDQRKLEDERKLKGALNEFRQLHQQPDSRREFDLYDPEAKKKDKPARLSDEDPRCGMASLQKFDGEDLNNKARNKYQEEQRRAWAEQQAREKRQAEENQKAADRLYELKMKELDQRALDLQQAEEACRKAIREAQSDYNKALARENAARRDLAKQQEQDDNATEQANHLYGDLLTENPAVATSAFGPHRVVPDRWKGMSPEQLAEVKRIQEMQINEQKRIKEEEKRLAEEHERQRLAAAKAAMLQEREHNRRKKEMDRQLANENARLADEQKANKDFLDKEVYTNAPTAAYFMQWNKTTR